MRTSGMQMHIRRAIAVGTVGFTMLFGLAMGSGTAYAIAADAYESDAATAQAKPLLLNASAQQRTLWPAGDIDIVSFNATAGIAYVIETQNGDPEYTDTRLTLYGPDGITVLTADDDSGGTRAARIGWRAPAAGAYFARVTGYHGGVTGSYTLSLGLAGSIKGRVTDVYSGDPVAGIQAELYRYAEEVDGGLIHGGWDIIQTTRTDSDGKYTLDAVKPGTYRVGFWDGAGLYSEQYYSAEPKVDFSDDVNVTAGSTVTGVNAVLRPVRRPVKLTLLAPSSCDYRSARLSGKLRDHTGKALAGARVQIQQSSNGATWTALTTLTTSASGSFSRVVSPSKKSYYRAYVSPFAVYASGVSDRRVVTPRVSLSTPIAPATMLSGNNYSTHGALRPRHVAGSVAVRIYRWRLVSGRWKSYGYVSATASDYSSYSRYSANLKLSARGRWRIRAYHPADGMNAATWSSGYRYVGVK